MKLSKSLLEQAAAVQRMADASHSQKSWLFPRSSDKSGSFVNIIYIIAIYISSLQSSSPGKGREAFFISDKGKKKSLVNITNFMLKQSYLQPYLLDQCLCHERDRERLLVRCLFQLKKVIRIWLLQLRHLIFLDPKESLNYLKLRKEFLF